MSIFYLLKGDYRVQDLECLKNLILSRPIGYSRIHSRGFDVVLCTKSLQVWEQGRVLDSAPGFGILCWKPWISQKKAFSGSQISSILRQHYDRYLPDRLYWPAPFAATSLFEIETICVSRGRIFPVSRNPGVILNLSVKDLPQPAALGLAAPVNTSSNLKQWHDQSF